MNTNDFNYGQTVRYLNLPLGFSLPSLDLSRDVLIR